MLNRVLIILLIAVNTLGRFAGDKYYFLCEAFALVFAGLFFYYNSKGTTHIIAQWALILIMGNLLDEIFFDPCNFGWNEVVITLIATIRAYYQWQTLKRS